jgi:cytochrome b subunit of formate dehydrogenase
LEINDGKMAGDQRVSEGFEKDYENFWDSTDIFFGKHKENEVGDSGYKVFIYSNGLVGLFLLALFYVLALIKAKNQRAAISAFILALLIFRVDGFVLIYARLIPLYLTAYIDGEETSSEKGEEQL